MTFACPDWDLTEVLRVAAELGYDGVEPRTDANHRHGIEVDMSAADRATARRQAGDSGVALCCLATSLQFIKVAQPDRDQLYDDTMRRIELAADLQIPGLRVFAGGVPEGVELDAALDCAGDNLRDAASAAAEAGVELWLETHDTVSKAVLTARILRRADHPAVACNYDVMHPYRLGEPLDETFAALDGRVRHSHFHDSLATPGAPEITRFGEGELPLVDILRWLKSQGFTGHLSGEWFNDQLGATPRESLAHYLAGTQALLAQI